MIGVRGVAIIIVEHIGVHELIRFVGKWSQVDGNGTRGRCAGT